MIGGMRYSWRECDGHLTGVSGITLLGLQLALAVECSLGVISDKETQKHMSGDYSLA